MKRIALINQKGGVGKTTTTVNLGAALARMGRRVLLIDMDPQANLTVHLDRRPELEERTLTNLLVDGEPLSELVQPTGCENVFVIPADTSLAGVEQVLANRIGREMIIREALEAWDGAQGFDYVLMDCPPSLGVLSANALVACDEVLIPMQAEYLALQGMAKLLEVIQLVQRRLNPELRIACILPCMVDQRTNLSAEVLAEIERHFGVLLARTRIRSNVKLAEAPSFGRTIFEHAPDSNGAHDYQEFAEEFLGLEGRGAPAETATVVAETVAETVPAAELEPEPTALEAPRDAHVELATPEAEEAAVGTEATTEPEVDPTIVDPAVPPAERAMGAD